MRKIKYRSKFIIFISVLILISLLIIQFLIIKNSIKSEKENTVILENLKELKKENFNSSIIIALTKVRDKLLLDNIELKDIYLDPVQKIQYNYFVVSFYDTIPKHLLQMYIKEEFESYYIKEEYQTGIYDCFTDSIIFDENIKWASLKKWNHDGYYFGVYFTNLKEEGIVKKIIFPYFLLFAFLISIFATIFIFYFIKTLLRQKRMSSITYDFINNMTHELKTPISTISLSTDVLLKSKGLDKERINRYLSIIKIENSRLETQVERVLQIAKLDKGVVELNFKFLDIHKIIKTCVETFQVPIEQRNGKLTYELTADKSIIYGDVVHITNLIYNLLDNANKYSKTFPEINIKTENINNSIKIVISDHGIGMKQEDIKNIFHRFFRISTGDIHNVKGFGIGLYYVKHIISRHYGEITVTSKVNKGSNFIIILPLKRD